jgi:hypothetical protein
VLRWRTADEVGVRAFRVHRGRDGDALEALGPDVAPRADGRYSFRDADPGPGRYVYRIGEVNAAGEVALHGSVDIEVQRAVPARTFLDAAVPNPFNPSTTLRYGVAQDGPMSLVVYDTRGRKVRTLERSDRATAGFRRVTWDGRSDHGTRVSSGVYYVRLNASGQVQTRRITLLK